MDTPPDVSAACRGGTEDHATDIEQYSEAQIAEFEQNIEPQVGKWAEEMKEKALRVEHDLRQHLRSVLGFLDELGKNRLRLEATGYPLPDDVHEALRQERQELLDMALEFELPEFAELVNAHPAFAGLGGEKEQRSLGAQQRKSRAAQRRKHRRR